jgi:hypothetical protein
VIAARLDGAGERGFGQLGRGAGDEPLRDPITISKSLVVPHVVITCVPLVNEISTHTQRTISTLQKRASMSFTNHKL